MSALAAPIRSRPCWSRRLRRRSLFWRSSLSPRLRGAGAGDDAARCRCPRSQPRPWPSAARRSVPNCRRLRVSLWLDRPGRPVARRGGARLAHRQRLSLSAEGQGRPNADRFAVSWLLTMAGSLGVFVAADLLTFYLVYALVSIPAYYLVAHDEDARLAPRRRRLSGVRAPRRSGAPDRLRHAGGGRAERQRRKFATSSPLCRLRPGAMRRSRSSSSASA